MLLHVMFLGLTAAASVSAASVSAAAVSACEGLSLFSTNTEGCLKQLKHMAASVETDVHFPNKLYKLIGRQNVESQLTFVHKNLQHIFHLYRHGNLTRLGWDATGFLSALHRQLSCLRPCVFTNDTEHQDVTRYYSRLENATHRTNGSLTLWQKINDVTRIHLYRLNGLVLSILQATTRGRYSRTTAPERSTGRTTAPERSTGRTTAPERSSTGNTGGTALERIIGRTAPERTTRRR